MIYLYKTYNYLLSLGLSPKMATLCFAVFRVALIILTFYLARKFFRWLIYKE